ncbi:MAG: biotin-dependent carboxyltransferase family protein, partial [Verrucomicrobiota bacterium]|nr:biotin-dependent carboxyltransferase family protein [Verrucomicrobiota bacterium]
MKATAIRAGFLTSVQDLGRTGFREFGVSLGGALDTHALRVANLLAGNDESAAGLEITFGGLRLRFADDRIVVWSGGDFDARIGSTSVAAGHPALVRAGEEFSIESPALGCRAWLAISGGIDVPIVLGSRSGDLKAGFGGVKGRPVRDGEEFPVDDNPPRAKILIDRLRGEKIARWKPPHDWSSPARRTPTLRYIRGTDSGRFVESALQFFNNESFFVSPDSDRMGIRLDGPRLERSEEVDLLSEAVAPGTVQVPPSGKPILLLNDCQTIGGYPKIAHVITVDL